MGLDLYTGSLTRYFSRQFLTPVQRLFGDKAKIVRVQPGRPASAVGPGQPGADARRVRENVLAWRKGLARQMGGALGGPLDWDESDEAPWWCEQPAWTGYGGLILSAAYAERPDLIPAQINVENWANDPAYKFVSSAKSPRYPHLFGVELWLPVHFDFPFAAAGLTKQPIPIGSIPALLAELLELNRRIWKLDLTKPDAAPPDLKDLSPVDAAAWRGFSTFFTMTRLAAEHRLPMKMDY